MPSKPPRLVVIAVAIQASKNLSLGRSEDLRESEGSNTGGSGEEDGADNGTGTSLNWLGGLGRRRAIAVVLITTGGLGGLAVLGDRLVDDGGEDGGVGRGDGLNLDVRALGLIWLLGVLRLLGGRRSWLGLVAVVIIVVTWGGRGSVRLVGGGGGSLLGGGIVVVVVNGADGGVRRDGHGGDLGLVMGALGDLGRALRDSLDDGGVDSRSGELLGVGEVALLGESAGDGASGKDGNGGETHFDGLVCFVKKRY